MTEQPTPNGGVVMGFVEREMARLETEIFSEQLHTERYRQLFAAQQALKWATDPQCFASPLDSIDGKAGQASTLPPQ